MKVGLFFGSFNPIHIGHLIIGSHMARNTDLNEVWFVVTPQNPLKNRRNLLDEYHRLEMVKVATQDDPQLRASDVEFHLPRPSFTVDTLAFLREKYPEHEFVLIMGSDTVKTLPKWKNHEVLVNDHEIYAYPRPGMGLDTNYANVTLMNTPLMEISASYIRRSIKSGKSVRYFLPDSVFEIIEKWGYYR